MDLLTTLRRGGAGRSHAVAVAVSSRRDSRPKYPRDQEGCQAGGRWTAGLSGLIELVSPEVERGRANTGVGACRRLDSVPWTA